MMVMDLSIGAGIKEMVRIVNEMKESGGMKTDVEEANENNDKEIAPVPVGGLVEKPVVGSWNEDTDETVRKDNLMVKASESVGNKNPDENFETGTDEKTSSSKENKDKKE